MQRLYFLVLPHVHLLDLSGPAQVFFEANGLGAPYELHYCATVARIRSAQGLWLSYLDPLPAVGPGDAIFVPGLDSSTLDRLEHVPVAWLRRAAETGARIASICSGAFALAHAGLLDGRRCATHWKVADRLEADYPGVTVLRDRLFVRDGRFVTSAGVASGIDMALSLVEEDHGPLLAARVARELVVYARRDGRSAQTSIYLEHRTHLDPGVHRVQDWLIAHPETRLKIDDLARVAGMSRRSLTRAFRRAVGITIKDFAGRLKLETARALLHDPGLSIEHVASRCGFRDARQLRRLCRARLGQSPSSLKGGRERSIAQ